MHHLLVSLLGLSDTLRRRLAARRATPAKLLGDHGEDLAQRYLQRHGYTIVARNYRPPNGYREIDLIARDGRALVIVEVKTRRHEGLFPAERAVEAAKRHNLVRAAMSYARRARIPWEFVRFDIVTVTLEPAPRLRHTPDAFHPDRRVRERPLYAAEVGD